MPKKEKCLREKVALTSRGGQQISQTIPPHKGVQSPGTYSCISSELLSPDLLRSSPKETGYYLEVTDFPLINTFEIPTTSRNKSPGAKFNNRNKDVLSFYIDYCLF